MIVSFEGLDGSGKSEQLARFQAMVGATAIPQYASLPRISPRMKRVEMFTRVEALRIELARLISPPDAIVRLEDAAVHGGKTHPYDVVVLDRSVDTTLAYSALFFQSAPPELREEYELFIKTWHAGVAKPDLTFLLHVDPAVSRDRLKARAGNDGEFDGMSTESWDLVDGRYMDLITTNRNKRFVLINANKSIEEVHSDIMEVYNTRISEATK